ncbi:hypothetical protein [Stutzerimonas kunmingensis]|nr:hypothetical protein [Stutzerimonas kunmingensis]
MQQTKNTTVRIYGQSGRIIGELKLPVSARLADLEALRTLGAIRVEVRP